MQDQEIFDFMMQSVMNESDALKELYNVMDREAYEKALSYLLESPITVTSACGSSGFTAKKFAHSLCCVECPAKFVPPSEAVHGGMGVILEHSVLVLVSKGGKSDELMPICRIAKAKGAKIILVTANNDSELACEADVVLLLPNIHESDKYDMMSTASYVATIGIFDALMMGIMEIKRFDEKDFAVIHPGGAVGKRLG